MKKRILYYVPIVCLILFFIVPANGKGRNQDDDWDNTANLLKHAWTLGNVNDADINLHEKPDVFESGLHLNISSDKVKIADLSGDDKNPAAELQVKATPTPLPSSLLLLGSGLGGLAFFRKRFKR